MITDEEYEELIRDAMKTWNALIKTGVVIPTGLDVIFQEILRNKIVEFKEKKTSASIPTVLHG